MNEEKLEANRLEIVSLNEKCEKNNQLIIEAVDSTTEDLRAANYLIHIYAELTVDMGRMLKLYQEQVGLLR